MPGNRFQPPQPVIRWLECLPTQEIDMPLLRKPLYQRSDGADEERWGLVFDTSANRLFVEHEKQHGDTRGRGYGIDNEELELADFLTGHGEGQQELVRLLGSLFPDHRDGQRP